MEPQLGLQDPSSQRPVSWEPEGSGRFGLELLWEIISGLKSWHQTKCRTFATITDPTCVLNGLDTTEFWASCTWRNWTNWIWTKCYYSNTAILGWSWFWRMAVCGVPAFAMGSTWDLSCICSELGLIALGEARTLEVDSSCPHQRSSFINQYPKNWVHRA